MRQGSGRRQRRRLTQDQSSVAAEQSPDLSQLRVFCMNAQGAALAVHACSLYVPEAAFAAAEQAFPCPPIRESCGCKFNATFADDEEKRFGVSCDPSRLNKVYVGREEEKESEEHMCPPVCMLCDVRCDACSVRCAVCRVP